jgi:GMP synthase-like glutamine amidotransferase
VRVLAIVHQRDAGPGVFARAAAARGDVIDEWLPSEQAEPPGSEHDAVMVFGGAMDTHEEDRYPWLRREKARLGEWLAAEVPLLGVCLGSQLLAEAAGGTARRATEPEIGWREVALEPAASGDPLLGSMPDRFASFQWHSYEAVPPPGTAVLAHSAICPQAYRLESRLAWGIQFHAEVTLADALAWIDGYRADPDADGIDPAAFSDETRAAIAGWNEIGQALGARFLEQAASRLAPGVEHAGRG